MKITNCGKGIHQREIPGIEKLKGLPDNWHAFTNLDLALPGKGVREIDLIMVIEDRLLLVDLKDWIGPISSQEGNWFNGKRDCGRSPVGKIAENVRELAPLLKKYIGEQEKKEQGLTHRLWVPWIEGVVILTRTNDRTGIAASEMARVFSVDPFMKMLRNRAEREAQLGASPSRQIDYTSPEWLVRFRRFFNTSSGIFKAGTRRYGGYQARANSESPTFRHKDGIFAEFDVEEEGVETSAGLLRRWDFTAAETRFQTEEGRATIAGRERSVIAWLDDRNPKCGEAVFKPKVEDPDRGVTYWEVFERRRRMQRLEDFRGTELPKLVTRERIELARQVLSQMTSIHDLHAAHLDIGSHSVWLELPTTVRLSHLMAASLPSVETLGESRFQFLSTSTVPEDVLGGPLDPLRKDVFLLGCVAHTLLFGAQPAGDPPDWTDEVDPDGTYSVLHPWFERCLDLDQSKRFPSASAMLDAFNAAVSSAPDGKRTRDGLERFKSLKSQRQVFQAYPETELIREDDRVLVWRSDSGESLRLVKLWKSSVIGDIAKEGPRVLTFLENVRAIAESPVPGIGNVLDVHWTEDAIVLVVEYVEGRTLSDVLEQAPGFGDVKGALEFLSCLVEVVDVIHERSISHGDIKPENIVVVPTEGGILHPVLIDVLDFSPARDGERLSRAYAPASGGRFERDRYAVTKISEDVLAPMSGKLSSWEEIQRAISDCRVAPPPNGTLLPLREALVRAQAPVQEVHEGAIYKVSIIGAPIGPMLSDEGRYWVSKRGARYFIRGATEQMAIDVDDTGLPIQAYRRVLAQSEIQRVRRHEYASFTGSIVVEGTIHGLSLLTELLQDLVEPGATGAARSVANVVDEESEDTEVGGASIEAGQDRISERISEEGRGIAIVDVPRLWKRAVELESELRTEVAVLGDSTYRSATRRHVAPIQLMIGGLDFHRNDSVQVERRGLKGHWSKIGTLDLQITTSEFIAISSWFDTARGPLLQDGDRLRFQSKYENISRERREQATSRILSAGAAVPALIEVFKPSTETLPRRIGRDVDEEAIAQRYGLNPIQISGFRNVLECRPVALLQGPPGTGKTRFIGALVHHALSTGIAKNVLLASQSHESVNNAAEAVLELFGDDRDTLSLIRVGSEGSVSEVLRPHHVARVEKGYKDRFSATRKQRFEGAAGALGLDREICDSVLYYEETVRPVITRLMEFARDGVDVGRINSLSRTAEELLNAKGVEIYLQQIDPDSIEGDVENAYFSKLPIGKAAHVEKLRQVMDLGRDIIGTVSTWQRSFETFLAGTRRVVAGTCVGLGRGSLGLTKTTFDLVVVDEAARCTPSELAVPIQSGKWVVLVGDHAQLEPLHPGEVVEALAEELGLPLHEVQRSDFERVFESAYGKAAGSTLTKQYRMLPPIGRIVSSAFYDRGLLHGRASPLIDQAAMPAELETPLVWIGTDAAGPEGYQRKDPNGSESLFNPLEVDAILALLRRWGEQEPFVNWIGERDDAVHAIGIICAYAAQRDYLWKRLQAENLPDVLRRAIKVDTIDSYQGKENLIVLLSLVRNNAEGVVDRGAKTIAPGFMGRKNRINVALSRAMDRLVIVGARIRWHSGSPMGLVAEAFAEEVKSGNAKVIDAQELIDSSTSSARSKKKGTKAKAADTLGDGV